MTCIVIPVFNAAAALSACLRTLRRSIPEGTTVLLIDDASTDPAVADLLAEHVATRACSRLLRNTANLGFVGSVNRALAATADDVLLLNSDTLPTPGFLVAMERCAAADPWIASVTPFSNNAEICSFPRFCAANPVPEDADRVAEAFGLETSVPVVVPTAVGFCMWMRRAAIAAVGDFDAATFGRGYGEENDWCMRAAAHGWRHVVCPAAYVAHVGHASFSATGERPGGENLARLVARYPRYNALVADFIERDPLAEIRARVAARLGVVTA
ncbi:MAG: glycosyltransferase family 2 protein [Xanthomonadales bacterium]|nr:glycosyltransferase family 2 protein [Xanthomonadales bacterium]